MSGSLNLPGSLVLGFGNTTRQMLNLYQTGYGIGVQDFTVYQRAAAVGSHGIREGCITTHRIIPAPMEPR